MQLNKIITKQELLKHKSKKFIKDNKEYYVINDHDNQEFYYEEITEGSNKGKFRLME